jgi:acetyl-CoA synthetase
MKLEFIIKTLNSIKSKSMSRYKINNLEEYFKEYKKSVREPKKIWDKIALKTLHGKEWIK